MMKQITNSGLYDHPVVAIQHPHSGTHLFFRRSTKHPGSSEGRFHHMVPGGQLEMVFPEPFGVGVDDIEMHGGVTSSGACVLFASRCHVNTQTWFTTMYRSTNGLLSFNDLGLLDVGTATDFACFGRMIEVPWTGSGKRLFMSVYSVAPSPKAWVVYSDDDGVTWHTGATISTLGHSEGCLAYVSGSGNSAKLIIVFRTEDFDNRLHQFVSADGGATWSNQGVLAFTSTTITGGAGPVSPDLLVLNDGRVVLVWADRKTWMISWTVGVGADLTTSVSAWGPAHSIYRSHAATRSGSFYGNFGYPSMAIGGVGGLGDIQVYFNDQDPASIEVGAPPQQPSVNLYQTELVKAVATVDLIPWPCRVVRADGLEFFKPKAVFTADILDGTGTVTIILQDGFTNTSTYICFPHDRNSGAAVTAVKNSGSSITLNGTPGHVIDVICLGE